MAWLNDGRPNPPAALSIVDEFLRSLRPTGSPPPPLALQVIIAALHAGSTDLRFDAPIASGVTKPQVWELQIDALAVARRNVAVADATGDDFAFTKVVVPPPQGRVLFTRTYSVSGLTGTSPDFAMASSPGPPPASPVRASARPANAAALSTVSAPSPLSAARGDVEAHSSYVVMEASRNRAQIARKVLQLERAVVVVALCVALTRALAKGGAVDAVTIDEALLCDLFTAAVVVMPPASSPLGEAIAAAVTAAKTPAVASLLQLGHVFALEHEGVAPRGVPLSAILSAETACLRAEVATLRGEVAAGFAELRRQRGLCEVQ